MIAGELARMTRADAGRLGGKTGEATPDLGLLPDDLSPVSVRQAADMLNVGRGTVEAAKKVIRDGVPELAEAVKSGEVSVSAAAEIAKAPAPSNVVVLHKELTEAEKVAIDADRKRPRSARAGGASRNGRKHASGGGERDLLTGVSRSPESKIVAE